MVPPPSGFAEVMVKVVRIAAPAMRNVLARIFILLSNVWIAFRFALRFWRAPILAGLQVQPAPGRARTPDPFPEPVCVPLVLAAFTVSAPSFVLCQSVSAGLLCVTCKVRRRWTRAQASSGLITSANDGIGVPSKPVMKILYKSLLVVPHLKREPDSKSYGWIG